MKSHQLIDERSLEFGKIVAERLRAEPNLIKSARTFVREALETCSPGVRPTLLEWQALVHGPVEEVLRVLTSRDERSVRLRQSSPFAGVIPEKQRLEIIKKFYDYESGTT